MDAGGTIDEADAATLIMRAETCLADQDCATAYSLYQTALALLRREQPDSQAVVRALVGLGWTAQGLDDCRAALELHQTALAEQMRIAPEMQSAICTIHRGIAASLAALGRFKPAQEQYRTVLRMQRALLDGQDPELAATLNVLGETAARLGHYAEAHACQQEALDILRANHPPGAPELAAALTNLGVSLYRLDRQQAAEQHLREALAIDPDLLLAAENLIYVLYQQGRKAEGRSLAAQKYRRQSFVVQPPPAHSVGTLLVLWSLDGNIPNHHLLGRLPMTVIDWHIQYANAEHERQLPAYDLAFNLIGDADQGAAALESAAAFQRRCPVALLNDPVQVQHTRRHMIPGLLAGIEDLVIPRVAQFPGAALRKPRRDGSLAAAGITLPLLLRTAGMHGGESVQRLRTEEALDQACAPLQDDDAVYVTAYHEYASPDGFHRKYRMIFVDREPYPYHLAISPDWLVHYFSADMEAHPWKLEEELRYLEDAPRVLGPRAMAVLRAIGARMDLDYCGADFALLPDGRVLLFECNATMLVHPEDAGGVLARKNPHVERIFSAFDVLVRHSLPAGGQRPDQCGGTAM